ncbi:hypothetical protein [Acinetobacter sp.]|uniref:hypothetical protein n=1 Tax=Acinetobacter sp. TaxID=472 RepID=UPI003340100B
MKFTFNFDLAIIISIFTGYLYWCGYWYQYGYTEFFNYPISPYDLSVIPTLITGLLIAVEETLYLTLTFILIAFFSGFSSKQWDFGVTKLSAWTANGIILIYFIFSKRVIPYFQEQLFKFISTRYSQLISIKYLKNSINRSIKERKNSNSKAIRFKNWIMRLSQESHTYTKSKMFEQNMTTEAISYSIYGQEKRSSETQNILKLVLYFFMLYFIICLLLWVIHSGDKSIKRGYQDAQLDFVNTFVPKSVNALPPFPLVESKSEKGLKDYHLTRFCAQGSCLIANKSKNVQTYKIDDLIIKNRPSKD